MIKIFSPYAYLYIGGGDEGHSLSQVGNMKDKIDLFLSTVNHESTGII